MYFFLTWCCCLKRMLTMEEVWCHSHVMIYIINLGNIAKWQRSHCLTRHIFIHSLTSVAGCTSHKGCHQVYLIYSLLMAWTFASTDRSQSIESSLRMLSNTGCKLCSQLSLGVGSMPQLWEQFRGREFNPARSDLCPPSLQLPNEVSHPDNGDHAPTALEE